LSAVYVNRHISALRAFSSFILAKGWHRRMVAGDLKTYPVNSFKSRQALHTSEERLLVKAIDLNGRNGLRDLAILQLFLQCGLQVSELVRLLRDDATIHKSVGRLRGETKKETRSALSLSMRSHGKLLTTTSRSRGPRRAELRCFFRSVVGV